jgi:hypothetical protein
LIPDETTWWEVMTMGPRLGDALRVWLGWTLALAVAVLAALFPLGFGTRWLLVVVAAGALDLWVLCACLRTWFAMAQYRWFWWTR